MAVTRKDVALQAGVSQSLVSMHINKSRAARMSDETRKKIDAAIRELGYRPDPVARSLSGGKSRSIGLVTGGIIRNAYELQALMNELKKYNYRLNISITNFNREEEHEAFEEMLSRRVDAVIYLLHLDPRDELFRRAQHDGIPVILVHQFTGGLLNSVVFDHREAFRGALREYTRHGHKEIVILSHPFDQEPRIFRELAEEAGVKTDTWVFLPTQRSREELFEKLLLHRPPAVFSTQGELLNQMYRYSWGRGVTYRPDIVHDYTKPFDGVCSEHALGYIHTPFRSLIEAIAARAVKLAEQPLQECREIQLPTCFIPAGELPALRQQEIADPYYASMRDYT